MREGPVSVVVHPPQRTTYRCHAVKPACPCISWISMSSSNDIPLATQTSQIPTIANEQCRGDVKRRSDSNGFGWKKVGSNAPDEPHILKLFPDLGAAPSASRAQLGPPLCPLPVDRRGLEGCRQRVGRAPVPGLGPGPVPRVGKKWARSLLEYQENWVKPSKHASDQHVPVYPRRFVQRLGVLVSARVHRPRASEQRDADAAGKQLTSRK